MEPNASMLNERPHPEFLFSLPPCVVEQLPEWKGRAFCDPPETKLGSGGGTAFLLVSAMQAQTDGSDFRAWLRGSRRVLVHGGGQSRRLPAYAATGKPLIPLPVFPGVYGQTGDQTLLSFQSSAFERVLAQAPDPSVVMIASGDVLLRFGRKLPLFPNADVIALGMEVSAEVAQHFGVFFLPLKRSESLAFFLQKPPPETIQRYAGNYRFLVDTGMWLLSERAVMTLMAKSGWNNETQTFSNGIPNTYELYADFGLSLGTESPVNDPEINALTCAVVTLPQPEFYHLGTSRQLIESVTALQTRLGKEGASHVSGLGMESTIHLQNAVCEASLRSGSNQNIWIENASIPASWHLHSDHVLTNIPLNAWELALPSGFCLDLPPVGEDERCLRAYGMDDSFSGKVGDDTTRWFGRSVTEWFARRSLTLEQAGITSNTDIQQARLFPVTAREQVDPDFLRWLFVSEPSASQNAQWSQFYLDAARLSAQEIGAQMDVRRVFEERQHFEQQAILEGIDGRESGAFFRRNLDAAAAQFQRAELTLPTAWNARFTPLDQMHALMFEARVKQLNGQADWKKSETSAFSALREAILDEAQMTPVVPRRDVLEDQIVWGAQSGAARSRRRLDRYAALLPRTRRQSGQSRRQLERSASGSSFRTPDRHAGIYYAVY